MTCNIHGWGGVHSAPWDSPERLSCSGSGSSIAISCRLRRHTLRSYSAGCDPCGCRDKRYVRPWCVLTDRSLLSSTSTGSVTRTGVGKPVMALGTVSVETPKMLLADPREHSVGKIRPERKCSLDTWGGGGVHFVFVFFWVPAMASWRSLLIRRHLRTCEQKPPVFMHSVL